MADATKKNGSGGGLTTMFIAAATAVITGIPTDFISEIIIFPFYHNSSLGTEIVNASSSILLPYYEAVGDWFGVPSLFDTSVSSVPSVSF
jgi:hypothetical protein